VIALRIVLLLIAGALTFPTAALVVNASPQDSIWWLAIILVGGAWCGWSLAWDWAISRRRIGRRQSTPRRGK
jgi:hypothetical protein